MTNCTDERQNITDLSVQTTINTITTSLVTAILTYTTQVLAPKIKRSFSSYNLHLAGKKIKEIFTCCYRKPNAIERFLSTDLDYDMYNGVLKVADHLHLMTKSIEGAKEESTEQGKFTYRFPTKEIIIKNINGEGLSPSSEKQLKDPNNQTWDRFLKMHKILKQQVYHHQELYHYLDNQISKWFAKGKCKFGIYEQNNQIIKNYYLGEYNTNTKHFEPQVVISIIENTNNILLNESDKQFYNKKFANINREKSYTQNLDKANNFQEQISAENNNQIDLEIT